MPKVIGVRFKRAGRIYYFSPENYEINTGDGVIVETARGTEYGTVVVSPKEVEEKLVVQPLKPVIRMATDKDLKSIERNEEKREGAIKTAVEKVKKHNLDMKIVDVEYTFDGSKVIFYFTAEGRVDFRELVKDLASAFRIRIELRQIGIRDECKMIGGVAPCGRACCCSNHLGDFEHVSIKMAKTQGLSLNPSKISGLCGRLMCCLGYENAHYAETNKRMPKLNSEVTTPDGKGTVFSNNALKERVTVRIPKAEGFELKEYPLSDVKGKHTVAEDVDRETGDEKALKDLE